MNKFPKYKEPIMLNLGAADQVFKGFIGIDIVDNGKNMVWDVRKGLPFPDNSVDEVISSHFIEHLDEDEAQALFQEIYRVLKQGKETKHRLPYSEHPTALYMGHKSFWNVERVDAMTGNEGLKGFKVKEASHTANELFFTLIKNG